MTAIMQRLVAIRTFSLSLWFHRLVARTTARVVGWAFSMPAVQAALVEQVRCGSPIGNALTNQIEDGVSNWDAENIHGLDRAIEQAIEGKFDEFERDFEVDADSVKNLKQEVEAYVDEFEIRATQVAGLDDEIDERLDKMADEVEDQLVRLIVQRLSY